MRGWVLDEPLLEFAGGGRDTDPRTGIELYGPADLSARTAPRAINVALVGDEASVTLAQQWLDRCRGPIEAQEARRQGLHPKWPGFSANSSFRSELVFDSRHRRALSRRELRKLDDRSPEHVVPEAVDLFLAELEALTEQDQPDVVLCCIPDAVLDAEAAGGRDDVPADAVRDEEPDGDKSDADEFSASPAFHDLLKARAMRFRVPLQLLRPSTFDPTQARKQRRRTHLPQQRQDDATVAWNVLTAMYYKAGGTPWRMTRESDDLEVCFVGVAFFRTADGEHIHTSVAQVFNQRGDGVIVRGGPATRSMEDRQLHVSRDDAEALLRDAMEAFKREHKHLPARVVVHKTSPFDEHESEGMLAAANASELDCELVWVTESPVRLFRHATLPPLRGTLLELARDDFVLYTRGSVEQYGCYPGSYIPRPLALRMQHVERDGRSLAEEFLQLSKMNWNSTAFDGRLPVSLRTARQVGNIIKHLGPNEPVERRYSHYM